MLLTLSHARRALCAAGFLAGLAAPVQAQWTQHPGFEGGAFSALVAVPGGVLGSVSGGPAFRFDGAAWSVALPRHYALWHIGADVYAQTDAGLVRSRDGGATFGAGPALPEGATLVSVDASGRLFATQDSAILISGDDGATWQRRVARSRARFTLGPTPVDFPSPLHSVRHAFLRGDTLFAVGNVYVLGDVYRLAPGDTEWTPTLVRATALADAQSVDVQRVGSRRIALTTGAQQAGRVYVSDDDARTWSVRTDGLPALDPGVNATLLTGPSTAYLRIDGAFYRLGGSTWTALPAPPPDAFHATASDHLYVSGASTTYRLDGTSWTALPRPIATSPRVVQVQGSSAVIASNDGLVRTSDRGTTFAPFGPPGLLGATFVPGTSVVFGTGPSGPLRSGDGGATWAPMTRPPMPTWIGTPAPETAAPLGDALYAGFGRGTCVEHCNGNDEWGGVYRTVDGGLTWTDASAGLPTGPTYPSRLHALASDGQRLFAATTRGCVRRDGDAWAAASCPGGSFAFQVVPTRAAWVALANGHPYTSTDGGASWTRVTAGLPLEADGRLPVLSTLVKASVEAATADGVWLVANVNGTARAYRFDGSGWQALSLAFPADIAFHSLAVGDGRLYAGSVGRGLWSTAVPASTAAEAPGAGAALTLSLPAPNPTRGRTRLVLNAPRGQVVRVEVLDVLGRPVALLHAGPVDASQEIDVDASTLAPGLYAVRASAGASVAVRPLLVR